MKFTFDGLEEAIDLPDKHLTFGQFDALTRHWQAKGITDEDLEDANTIRGLCEVLLGKEVMATIDAAPFTKENFSKIQALNNHMGKLLLSAVEVGDSIVNDVEKKGQPLAPTQGAKRRGRPKKNK